MSGDVNELTISYEEDDVLLTKETDKVILSKGAWTTILYRYQQLNRKTDEYGDDRYSIRRYQKRNGQYIPKSKFNISSAAQAQKIIDALSTWLDKDK